MQGGGGQVEAREDESRGDSNKQVGEGKWTRAGGIGQWKRKIKSRQKREKPNQWKRMRTGKRWGRNGEGWKRAGREWERRAGGGEIRERRVI